MVDVLHHLVSPRRFFSEAQRVVRAHGRIVLIEPAITPVSSLFFRLLHHEPVDMRVDPLADIASDKVRDPYDSNQAIPTLLFGRYRQAFAVHFPSLKVREKRWMSLLAYPLSGVPSMESHAGRTGRERIAAGVVNRPCPWTSHGLPSRNCH